MARFVNLTSVGKIKDEYTNINAGFAHVNDHFDGTAEKHPASDITNDSTVTGDNVDDALNTLKSNIDALVLGDANATIGIYSINASGTDTLTGIYTDLTYFDGLKINLTIENTNTGAVTFNLNGLGAKAIKKVDGEGTKVSLDARDLLDGKVAQLEYDGTDFILINAKDVATYSAEQETQAIITSLPSYAQGGEIDGVVRGQTIVNLASFGGCEATTGWSAINGTITTDSSNKFEGDNCLKVTNSGVNADYYRSILSLLDITKYYLITAHLKNGNLSGDGVRIRVNCIGDVGNVSSDYITDTKYNRVSVLLQPSNFDGASDVVLRIFTDGASTEYAFLDAIQINEITADEYTAGVNQELLNVYPFVNGIKHADGRIKAVGKNLFDKDNVLFNKKINNATGVLNTLADNSASFFINIKSNTNYYWNYGVAGNREIAFYDSNKNYISGLSASSVISWTSPSNAEYVRLSIKTSSLDVAQLEEGTSATAYEPYTESVRYLNKSLKSLPNGTRDTIDNNGVYTQRVSDVVEISDTDYASIDTSTYTNVDVVKTTTLAGMKGATTSADDIALVLNKDGEILSEVAQADIDLVASVGKYYIHTDETIWFIVADGTYADIGTARTGLGTSKTIYELATPTIEELPYQPLQSQSNGTIYNEPVTMEVLTYLSGLTLSKNLYQEDKNFILSLYLVDGDTKTPIDLADVTVASATSLTISGASDDEQYEIVYQFAEATLPQFNFEYPLDDTAQLDDTSKVLNKLATKVEEHIKYQNAVNVLFDARLTALETP